ncbi:MAG: ABC transporter permease subunit [Rhizobium sp.]
MAIDLMNAPASAASERSAAFRVAASWLHAHPKGAALLLAAPALAYLALLYFLPLVQVLLRSVFTPGFSIVNYTRLFTSGIYWNSFAITFRISAVVAVICLALGYPVAILLTRIHAGWRVLAFAFILIPYWTSALVRTYAWTVILQRRGVVNSFLQQMGLIDAPLQLSYTTFGTIIGNVHILLPTMILTLYAGLQRIDKSLVTAARTLGARPLHAFLHVYFPLSIPAIVAGTTLTFVASLSSYIIPALLGGRKDLFIAQLIDQQVNQLLDVGFASAIAMVLLVACVIISIAYTRIIDRQGGRSGEHQQKPATMPLTAASHVCAGFSVLVIAFLVLPTFVLVPLSFSSARYLTFPPPGYSLQWYESYLQNPVWIEATMRSLRIGVFAAACASLLGTFAALGLSRLRGFLRYFLFTLMLLPLLIPNIIYALAVYQLYSALGLIGTETGLVLAHTVLGMPYALITTIAALSRRDEQLALAARTLGAGPAAAFAFVQFPLLRQSMLVGAFFAFITSFDEVIIAIFVSGARATTLPKMMWDGVTNEVNPTISAVSVVMITVSLTLVAVGAVFGRRRR